MTIEQTRQLGIEFERRIQTMIPDKEYGEKLDTETIYSFLNQYQDKYIHEIYRALDKVPASNNSAYLESIVRGLISNQSITLSDDPASNVYQFKLNDDFGLYINSTTVASESWAYKKEESGNVIMQNELITKTQEHKLVSDAHDSMRIIRKPLVCFTGNNSIELIVDRYTIPTEFNMYYYKIPKYMNLFTQDKCELPMDAFDDLVSGAVDLYVEYVAGAEARKRQLNEQTKKRAREDQRDARRSGGNQDEQS